MKEYKVEIDDKQWDTALKRHEDAWKKELDEVDIRAVVLKTKKAVLEQARSNSRCETATVGFDARIKDAQRQVDSFQRQIEDLKLALARSNKSFSAAVELLSKKEEKPKGFFGRIWERLKCLLK